MLEAQNDLAVAQRQLAQILDIAQTTNVTATDPIELAGEWVLNLEETILAAYSSRAELEQQLLERSISQNEVRLARSSLLPQITLSADYTAQNDLIDQTQTTIVGQQTITTISSRGLQNSVSISLGVQWNFFDGGAARAQVEQAAADIAIAKSEFADQRSEIRFEVENAFLTLESQQQQVSAAQVGIESAREGLRLAQLRLQAGVGTQLEVIDAQRSLTEAEGNLSEATGYNRALTQLQRSVSNL